MALVVNDRVKETTAVVGTGTATLLGAALGFQSFAVIGNGNTTYYCISDQGGANWEVGIGTYTASGTTLARTTVLASSNAGALVVFTAGVKDVFVTYPSEKGVWYDASGNVLFTGTTTAANLAYTDTLTGSTGILNIGSGQLYKDASGNVGIGTSSPRALLDVKKGGVSFLPSNSSYYAASIYNAQNATTRYGLQVRTNWAAAENKVVSFGNVNASTGADLEYFVVDGVGNVGIGTSSPATTVKLDVVGRIRVEGFVSDTSSVIEYKNYAGNLAYNYLDNSQNFIWQIAGSERIRINSSGIVLIGTTSASGTNKLQVSSDALINGINVGLGGGVSTFNAALGLNTLSQNSAVSYFNTAIGYNCLANNVLGQNNTATGASALSLNTTVIATFGTITGGSGYTDGSYTNIQLTYSSGSTAITYPLVNITVAGGVVTACTLVVAANGTSGGVGFKDITTVMSCANTVIGGGAGSGFAISPATLASGAGNHAFGVGALGVNTKGNNNCAMGIYVLNANTVGSNNAAVGNQAMFTNQTGSNNSAFGNVALRQNVSGGNNCAFGNNALYNVTGSTNTGIGAGSGSSITSGSNNVVIGGYTGSAAPISATGSNYVVLSDGNGNIRTYYDASGNKVNYGVNATSAAAPTIASATTIAPTKAITFISGVTPIVTITAPSPISLGGGQITLIPTDIFTTTTAGNIALASTAVVSRALIMTYDVTTAKWYPSY